MLRGAGLNDADVAARLHPGYPPASFGWMLDGTGGAGTMPAVDTVYLAPFRVFSRIVVNTVFNRTATGGAGSSVKVAIWRNNYATARPTGLAVIGTNTPLDTTASSQNDNFAVANITLDPGIYWHGTKGTGTLPTMVSVGPSTVGILIAAASIGAIPAPVQGLAVTDAFANDIMALDLTSASFTPVISSGVPAIGLGWN